jgi:hypothetical protein
MKISGFAARLNLYLKERLRLSDIIQQAVLFSETIISDNNNNLLINDSIL